MVIPAGRVGDSRIRQAFTNLAMAGDAVESLELRASDARRYAARRNLTHGSHMFGVASGTTEWGMPEQLRKARIYELHGILPTHERARLAHHRCVVGRAKGCKRIPEGAEAQGDVGMRATRRITRPVAGTAGVITHGHKSLLMAGLTIVRKESVSHR